MEAEPARAGRGGPRTAIEGVQESAASKDLDTGLVDFPTLFRGVEVLFAGNWVSRDQVLARHG